MSDYAAWAFDFSFYFLTQRELAFRRAFRNVRRDVWDARESRLRAKWESYG